MGDGNNVNLSNYMVGGTPAYMAPEILKNEYDPNKHGDKADVYSFGILINELITEKQPYHGKNFGDLIKIVSVDKPKPGVNRPDFVDDMSPKLKQLIKSCWDTKPDNRPGFAQLDKEKAWEVSLEDRDSGYAANIKKLFHEKDGSDKKTFKFGAFVRELAQYLHESKNLHITDPDKGPFDSIYIRTLQVSLGLKKSNSSS